ncbi:hypothetical protein M9H77_28846 [Catharanthus roseus]|uniref:Uncharacterized protein n=1 Tax=Catharanthus roseus TaxID=4058 RepID=A0ACC0AKU3_CATRO|nr:hypothetical protein M9H77_28846 [Catharanthus roseus]
MYTRFNRDRNCEKFILMNRTVNPEINTADSETAGVTTMKQVYENVNSEQNRCRKPKSKAKQKRKKPNLLQIGFSSSSTSPEHDRRISRRVTQKNEQKGCSKEERGRQKVREQEEAAAAQATNERIRVG